MIILTFRALTGDGSVQIRGAHFRICADATLRGPDNSIAARYLAPSWQFGRRQYRGFECSGPLYLRVTCQTGERERLGPYASIRGTDSGLFSGENYLGTYLPEWQLDARLCWREVAFLSANKLDGSADETMPISHCALMPLAGSRRT